MRNELTDFISHLAEAKKNSKALNYGGFRSGSKNVGRVHAVEIGIAGHNGIGGFCVERLTVYFVNGYASDGGRPEPALVAVSFALIKGDGGIAMVLMWSVYLLNAIFMFIKWYKDSAESKAENTAAAVTE